MDQVLVELTSSILSSASSAPVNALPKKSAAIGSSSSAQPAAAAPEEEDGAALNDDQMAEMRARLQAL